MNCQNCDVSMNDLSHGLGIGRHYFCRKCGSHFYEKVDGMFNGVKEWGKWFTRKEWFFYINGREESYEDF